AGAEVIDDLDGAELIEAAFILKDGFEARVLFRAVVLVVRGAGSHKGCPYGVGRPAGSHKGCPYGGSGPRAKARGMGSGQTKGRDDVAAETAHFFGKLEGSAGSLTEPEGDCRRSAVGVLDANDAGTGLYATDLPGGAA